MAAFQKSQDIDILSVRKIFAKGDNNTTIPANSFLGTDGLGGTQWVNISTIKNGITFNSFVTSHSTFTSGPTSSQFSILDGDNAGLIPSGSGNSVELYAKAFGKIEVVGQSSISAFNSLTGNINSNVKFSGTGIINISTDTSKQLINFYSPNDATSTMSTVVGNFVGLNGSLSNTIASFNSPFSTFIYSAISSFSTVLGPVISPLQVFSTVSSFSTSLGPVISPSQVFSTVSSFSTSLGPVISPSQVFSTVSSFSTSLGPVISPLQVYSQLSSFSTVLGPVISPLQVYSQLSSFSTSLGPVISPSQVYFTISSFSTAQGINIKNQVYTATLNTSTLNVSGVRQPFIQYGSSLLTNGSTIVALNPSYSTTSFNIQLTYVLGISTPSIPLSFSTMNASNFKVIGDPGATFHWTTYGNLF